MISFSITRISSCHIYTASFFGKNLSALQIGQAKVCTVNDQHKNSGGNGSGNVNRSEHPDDLAGRRKAHDGINVGQQQEKAEMAEVMSICYNYKKYMKVCNNEYSFDLRKPQKTG